MKRKSISTRTRFEVFKRDIFTCQYCGANPPAVILHVDHIVPVSKGGDFHMDNLVTSCSCCNMGKSNVSLTTVPKSLAEKASEVAENEKQLLGYQKILRAKRKRIDREMWEVANIFLDRFSDDKIKKTYLSSIKNFNEKLGLESVIDAMEIATVKKYYENACFAYFCGICWNRIRRAEQPANA